MATATSIEWTRPPGYRGATWNPTIGCRRVSPGCGGKRGEGGCYAEKMAGRIVRMGGPAAERYRLVVKHDEAGKPLGQWNGRFLELLEALHIPARVRKPTAWFVDSMSDLFGEGVSFEFIDRVFGVMAACQWLGPDAMPGHIFQVLTKRAERLAEYLSTDRREAWARWGVYYCGAIDPDGIFDQIAFGPRALPNVWLGVSVERQKEAEERIPLLLRAAAAVRFLSVEPMLERVNVSRYLPAWFCDACGHFMLGRGDDGCAVDEGEAEPCCSKCSSLKVRSVGVDWVIVGGESGGGARAFDVGGALDIRRQCRDADVAYFFKQAGKRPFLTAEDMLKFSLDAGGVRWGAAPKGAPAGASGLRLKSPKGGNLAELPPQLRIRQFPKSLLLEAA